MCLAESLAHGKHSTTSAEKLNVQRPIDHVKEPKTYPKSNGKLLKYFIKGMI